MEGNRESSGRIRKEGREREKNWEGRLRRGGI